MARKTYKYSLATKDRKIAGVAATAGDLTGVDPTFYRLAWLASIFVISWQFAFFSYIAMGVFFTYMKWKAGKGSERRGDGLSDFEKMGKLLEGRRKKGSTHDMLNTLDASDRRMMAIDHHLNSADSDELAREIEKLREKK